MPRIENDFEYFVKSLPYLEPVEFLGLAKILGVKVVNVDKVVELDKEKFEALKDGEMLEAKIEETLVPADEILEKMMDKFLTLNKKRRREINQILKEIKKSKKQKVM